MSALPRGFAAARRHDILANLASARAALIGNKTRDFAAEVTTRTGKVWPVQNVETFSLATGEAVTLPCAAAYNAQERAFALNHSLRANYDICRMRAMRPASGLAQADMLANATRCEDFAARCFGAWSKAA